MIRLTTLEIIPSAITITNKKEVAIATSYPSTNPALALKADPY